MLALFLGLPHLTLQYREDAVAHTVLDDGDQPDAHDFGAEIECGHDLRRCLGLHEIGQKALQSGLICGRNEGGEAFADQCRLRLRQDLTGPRIHPGDAAVAVHLERPRSEGPEDGHEVPPLLQQFTDDASRAEVLVAEDFPLHSLRPRHRKPSDRGQEILRGNRKAALRDVSIGSQRREKRLILRAEAGKGNDRGLLETRVLAQGSAKPATVQFWENDIQDDVIRIDRPDEPEGLEPVARRVYLIARAAQSGLSRHGHEDHRVVVDKNDSLSFTPRLAVSQCHDRPQPLGPGYLRTA